MSGLGGIIQWDQQPAASSQIRHMMHMVRHRGPDGLWFDSSGNVALGFALLAMKKRDSQHPQPVWLPDKSCAVVADAALYNRDEILRCLGTVSWWQGQPSDAAIILAAYERWGVDLLHLLDGDFAFAVWDQRREQIFAARDPLSGKSFFYTHDAHRFLFASEPKQLLTQPAVSVEPDEDVVGDLLLANSFRRLERTFFKGIWRLKPGHYLTATPDKVEQRRWWRPDPGKEIWYEEPEAYYAQFRELLKTAVARRIDTDFAVAVQLSGGFDSSSLVVLADEYIRQNTKDLPPLETYSFVYPHDSCDESPYIKAVLDQVAFGSNGVAARNRATSIAEIVEETWRQDGPFSSNFPASDKQLAGIVSGRGARIEINGEGGDELAHLSYGLDDLIRHGRFLALAQAAWSNSGESTGGFMRQLYAAAKGAAPAFMKRHLRWLAKSRTAENPTWFAPQFSVRYPSHIAQPPAAQQRFRSSGQNMVWDALNAPRFTWLVESIARQSSWNGYETRLPYCDRPLVEFVLAMPIEQRFKGEQWRGLMRQSLAGSLPPLVAQRQSKAAFLPYFKRVFAGSQSQYEQFLFSSEWLSEPYISRAAAEQLFQSNSAPGADQSTVRYLLLRDILRLETWLRGLPRYSKSACTTEPR